MDSSFARKTFIDDTRRTEKYFFRNTWRVDSKIALSDNKFLRQLCGSILTNKNILYLFTHVVVVVTLLKTILKIAAWPLKLLKYYSLSFLCVQIFL